MAEQRGPHNRGKCPFYVVPQNPLSAESSIHHCANCAVGNKAHLRSYKEELRQTAFLTVLEGRVSQITKSALEKLGKAYLSTLESVRGNPYRDTEQ